MPKIYGYTEIFDDIIIHGSFSVLGSASVINTTNLSVSDPIILLAASQSGTPTLDSGFFINRGTGATQAFIWDESVDEFAFIQTTDSSSAIGNVNITSYANVRAGGATFAQLTITNGATNNFVMTSNASGNTTWTSPATVLSNASGVTGSGTIGYHPRWTSSNNLSATSSIYDNGLRVGIGITNSAAILHVSNTSTTIPLIIASGSSTADLVRLTQLGTGNAFVVEDSTNPDVTPFAISNNGDTGIGTSSLVNTKLILQAGGTTSAFFSSQIRDSIGQTVAHFRADGNIQLGSTTKPTSVVITALANQTNIFRITSSSGNEHFGYDSISNNAVIRMGHSSAGGSFSVNLRDYWFYSLGDTKPALSITGQSAFNQTHVALGNSASQSYKLWVYKDRTSNNALHEGQRIDIVGSVTASVGANNTTYGLNIQNTGMYNNLQPGFKYSSVGLNIGVTGSDLNVGGAISVSGTYSNVGLTVSVSGASTNIGVAINSGSFIYAPGAVNGYVLVSDANGVSSWTASSNIISGGGGVTGSGTTNYVPRWLTSTQLSSTSSIYDTTEFVGIRTTATTSYSISSNHLFERFRVNGSSRFDGTMYLYSSTNESPVLSALDVSDVLVIQRNTSNTSNAYSYIISGSQGTSGLWLGSSIDTTESGIRRNNNTGQFIISNNNFGAIIIASGSGNQVGIGQFDNFDGLLNVGASLNQGSVAIYGQTTGRVIITTNAVAGTWSLTLPTTAGTNNYLLSTDGSGVTSWVSPSSVGGVTGSGTINYIPKWITSTQLGTSSISESGNTVSVVDNLDVTGLARVNRTGTNSYVSLGIDSAFEGQYLTNSTLASSVISGVAGLAKPTGLTVSSASFYVGALGVSYYDRDTSFATTAGLGTGGRMIGLLGELAYVTSGGGTSQGGSGVMSVLVNSGAGFTVSHITGFRSTWNNQISNTGRTENYYGFYMVDDFTNGVATNIGNRYGVYIDDPQAQNIFQGTVSVGNTNRTYKMEVTGTVSTTGFRMTNGAVNGYVLTSNSNGDATWQVASVTGSGTTNYGARWTTSTQLGTGSIYDDGSFVGIGTQSSTSYRVSVYGDVNILGTLYATSKSFEIVHPLDSTKRLTYGSLEGPEYGVYYRGKLDSENIINLPDYWIGLVDESTISVNITPFGQYQRLFVDRIEDNKVYIGSDNSGSPKCYYIVYGERKDIPKIIVEK